MASDLPVIGSVIGIISSIGGVVEAFSGSHASMPSMPSIPQYQIPQQQLDMLNQQIANNNTLSNQSQQEAQQALQMYNQGQLSPSYQAVYDQQYNNALNNIKQQLAASGFTPNSTQWQSAMNSFNQWASSTKAQLLQKQLSDSFTAAGISKDQQNQMLNSWKTQSEITGQNAANTANISNAYANQVRAAAEKQSINDQSAAALIGAGQNLGKSLSSLGGGSSLDLSASSPTYDMGNGTSLTGTGELTLGSLANPSTNSWAYNNALSSLGE